MQRYLWCCLVNLAGRAVQHYSTQNHTQSGKVVLAQSYGYKSLPESKLSRAA